MKFKKKESYVIKGNLQTKAGDAVAGTQTILSGLNHYQNKIMKAVNPYTVSDAALIVLALRSFADSVESQNPNCKPLVDFLDEKLKNPEYVTKKTKLK